MKGSDSFLFFILLTNSGLFFLSGISNSLFSKLGLLSPAANL